MQRIDETFETYKKQESNQLKSLHASIRKYKKLIYSRFGECIICEIGLEENYRIIIRKNVDLLKINFYDI